jgi:hypothetical protein
MIISNYLNTSNADSNEDSAPEVSFTQLLGSPLFDFNFFTQITVHLQLYVHPRQTLNLDYTSLHLHLSTFTNLFENCFMILK